MDIAAEVTLHLQCAGPTLECKHGLPVQPEVCAPEGLGQHLGNLLVLQILFGGQEQLGQGQSRRLIQLEFSIRVGVLTAVDGGAAERIVGVVLVEPIILVQYGNAGGLNGGNIPEGIPHDLKMVVHFTATAHEEALGDVLAAVAAAAGQIQLLQQMNVLALHLTVPHQIEGCGETGQTGADDISGFFIHTLGLLGVGKGFISACGIIHKITSCVVVFSCCLHYIRIFSLYHRQKKPRDKILITGWESVKILIKTGKMIKTPQT